MTEVQDGIERRTGEGPEFRLFGPPGTGKTTWISRKIAATARARGSDSVVAASFTTTAAAELAGRDLPVPKRQIGTLHSLAFRSIDSPRVVEEELADWNKTHPAYALTLKPGARMNLDDGAAIEMGQGATEGDDFLNRMEKLRARMAPRDGWPAQVRGFSNAWESWKRDNDLIDFTDMIELALEQVPRAPGNPEVGFFDEVQDFTPLELALIRKWGSQMERIVLAGDDDQCLYRFKGATPDAFLDPPVPDVDKQVLEQSWRVPNSVHRVAESWVHRLSRREPKLYLPREEEGKVDFLPLHYNDTQRVVGAVEEAMAAGTVMLLTTCSYMLDPVKHEMRKQGIPFHNPFRRSRGDWNPLKPSRGTSSRERLLAYLVIDERMFGEAARLWTGGDVKRWSHVVKTNGVFIRGAKDTIAGLPDNAEVPFTTLAALFKDETELEQAVTPDLDWFSRNLLAASRGPLEFPITVVRRRGAAALIEEPQVVLGTIHSVKGGQADTVFLFPDLSARGQEEWTEQTAGSAEARREGKDAVIRQMYVGMTRARERLVLCSPAGYRYVPPELMFAGVKGAA